MNILKRLAIRLLVRRARPYLRSFGLLQTSKLKPALVWQPEGRPVLVLSPHMDDEVIGCGGAIAKHIGAGAAVTVVYMTDGRTGSKALEHMHGAARQQYQQELVATRKREAQAALQTLGVEEGIFLDAEETQLASTPELQRQLRAVLERVRPEVVYVPFFLEEHPDHRATNQVLFDAVAGTSLRFDCLGYEIWTPLFPNCLVPIDDVLEIKKRALLHYRSQLADLDYLHTSLGLNAYRAGALLDNSGGFAEAFFMAPLSIYRELFDECRQAQQPAPLATGGKVQRGVSSSK